MRIKSTKKGVQKVKKSEKKAGKSIGKVFGCMKLKAVFSCQVFLKVLQ